MSPKELRARLAIVWLRLALVSSAAAWGEEVPTPPGRTAVRTIYQRNRSFRIPFNVPEAERPRRKEVQLWKSEDSGGTWTLAGRASPDQPSFTFRAPRDGEYWFTVRILDESGRMYPGDSEKVEPRIKVVVDTVPPFLALESGDRTGSQATVRWEVRDSYLDLKSLALETQAGDETTWHPVAIRRPSLIGGESWDPGSPKPLKVRVSVADKAGNRIETVLSLPKMPPIASTLDPSVLKPTALKLAGSEPREPRPRAPEPLKIRVSVTDKAGNQSETVLSAPVDTRVVPSSFTATEAKAAEPKAQAMEPTVPSSTEAPPRPLELNISPPPDLAPLAMEAKVSPPTDPSPSAPEPVTPKPSEATRSDQGTIEARPSAPEPIDGGPPPGLPPDLPPDLPSPDRVKTNPTFPPVDVGMLETSPPAPSPRGGTESGPTAFPAVDRRARVDPEIIKAAAPPVVPEEKRPVRTPIQPGSTASRPLRVRGPRFDLPYAVDDGGPDGPATVELWITRDGGRVWKRFILDHDHKPPFEVEINAEGTFGFWLVARDVNGEGDRLPRAGDRPQLWVEVEFDPRRNKPDLR